MSEDIVKDEPVLAQEAESEPIVVDNEVEVTVEAAEELPVAVEAPEEIVEQVVEVVEESKASDIAVENDVIASPSASKTPKEKAPALRPVGNGVIGSSHANKKDKVVATPAKQENTVAIYSTRNVVWTEVGKVSRGYNIVSEEAAQKWLQRDHIRLATPEDVAKGFGL